VTLDSSLVNYMSSPTVLLIINLNLYIYMSRDGKIFSQYKNSRVLRNTNPMVVMKLVVKEPSEKRKSRQLFPTPTKTLTRTGMSINHKRQKNKTRHGM
jgi:hypothetical protein